MARIAGVTTQKNIKGEITHVTINIKKRPEALPLLEQIGVIKKNNLQKITEQENCLTIEQSRQQSLARLRNLPWKK